MRLVEGVLTPPPRTHLALTFLALVCRARSAADRDFAHGNPLRSLWSIY